MKSFILIIISVFTIFIFQTCLLAQAVDTLKTFSGLQYLVLKKGTGAKPWPGKKVSIFYKVSQADGRHIDSLTTGKPYTESFNKENFVEGLVEGIGLMSKGDKYRFILPPKLAYGPGGKKDPSDSTKYVIDPNATIIYDIELVDFKK